MPKRSATEKFEYYQRKLQKLADKEKRRLEALQTPGQWEPNEENNYTTRVIDDDQLAAEQQVSPLHESESEEANEEIAFLSEGDPNHLPSTPPDNTLPTETALQSVAVAVPSNEIVETPTIPVLDAELLSALGEATDDAPKFGPNIHPNLAERWQPLLRKGLTKEVKEKLQKDYLVPENCSLLQAPKLNAEIAAAITEMARNRDKKMETAQQQLGVGISAMNKALTLLLTGEDKLTAIKHLSDSCRLLSDLHFQETQTRIKLLTPGLAKPFLNIIQDSERDETLFGSKLPDKIKASKVIEKQGLQIKKTTAAGSKSTAPSSSSSSTATRTNYSHQGNWQGPPRFPSNRGGRGGLRKSATTGNSRKTTQPQSRPAGQSKSRTATHQ